MIQVSVFTSYHATMRAWAWNIFAAASLVIFFLAAGLWVRSWFAWECLEYTSNLPALESLQRRTICCGRGAVRISCVRSTGMLKDRMLGLEHFSRRPAQNVLSSAAHSDRPKLTFAGFQWHYWDEHGAWVATLKVFWDETYRDQGWHLCPPPLALFPRRDPAAPVVAALAKDAHPRLPHRPAPTTDHGQLTRDEPNPAK